MQRTRVTREEEFGESISPTMDTRRPVVYARSQSYTGSNLAYMLFGILEILLAFRLIFLLLGANSSNGFVSFIYALSYPFVAPFYGIFGNISTDGAIQSTFDTATIIAMIVYAAIGWAILRLIAASHNRPADRL